MHQRDDQALLEAISAYVARRVEMSPPPLDGPMDQPTLDRVVGRTVTPEGIGASEALRRFTDLLAPATISVDHPLYLSFVPAAPTTASILFDLVVSASSIYGGTWLEGAGAVWAENQALAWLAELAGLPESAGGVFVSGGTAGNHSALLAARDHWRTQHGSTMDRVRGLVVASSGAHSSIAQTARAMDADLVIAPCDERGRLDGSSLRSSIDDLTSEDRDRVFAVVATAGTTNAGVIDDLGGIADVAEACGVWFHVDGAYGAAALCVPELRPRFEGIERCDSFIVDPHKWLFAPFDCCALLFRDPQLARDAHTQHAEYLDVIHDTDLPGWNPSDLAHHLTRRARGLPLWFSLAVHGTDAYADAVRVGAAVAGDVAACIQAAEHLELLMDPELSVVLFRRPGWTPGQYRAWSDRTLAEERAFVMPTTWAGETVLRFCFINPTTTVTMVEDLLETLR